MTLIETWQAILDGGAVVKAAIAEYQNPDTPDDAAALEAAVTKELTDLGEAPVAAKVAQIFSAVIITATTAIRATSTGGLGAGIGAGILSGLESGLTAAGITLPPSVESVLLLVLEPLLSSLI